MTLRLEQVAIRRGETVVLRDVSLEVSAGEVLAVLGRNGAGKTTLLRSVMGLSPPHHGQILVNGQEVTGLATHTIAKLGVAMVPETRGVLPSLTVRETLGLASGRRPGPWSLERVESLFPRLAERQGHRGNQLSGGEQQMLGLASALLLNPLALLLDEPTQGLAPLVAAEIGRTVAQLATEGLAVLLVEQNHQFASSLASRAMLLGQGGVRWAGTMVALKEDREIQSTWLGV